MRLSSEGRRFKRADLGERCDVCLVKCKCLLCLPPWTVVSLISIIEAHLREVLEVADGYTVHKFPPQMGMICLRQEYAPTIFCYLLTNRAKLPSLQVLTRLLKGRPGIGFACKNEPQVFSTSCQSMEERAVCALVYTTQHLQKRLSLISSDIINYRLTGRYSGVVIR